MNKIICIISIYFLLIACESYSPDICKVLELSGSNRGELEKVLQHYSKPEDSLKFQAACFLIKNMPGHFTLRGEKIDYYRQIIDKDPVSSYYFKKLYDITLDHFIPKDENVRREEDVEYITADFLIRHIDSSFELLDEQGLLDFIPFDLILKHVLPYRFRNERLDLWRDSMQVTSKSNSIGSYMHSLTKLKLNFTLNDSKIANQKFICDLLQNDLFTDCFFIACNFMLERRSLGIPVVLDCIPIYSNRNGYHYWCVDPPFLYKDLSIVGAYDRRTAKIYRHTFARNPVPTARKGEFIPDIFQNPFMQDVTDMYCYTSDIEIECHTRNRASHAYLCVFNNLEWKPIVAGNVVRDKVEFKKLAKNIVYLPVYYENPDKYSPFDYPFILSTKGTIEYLIPDSINTHTLHLERKNPDLMNSLPSYYKSLDKTVVEASNEENFLRFDTVFLFSESDKLFYESRNVKPGKPYRYYRIRKASNKYISEIYLFNSKGEIIRGTVDAKNQAVADGNPLTNISLAYNPLIIQFNEPVYIDKLVCLPRNDGNGIYPNNLYELLYHDANGWQSLGVKEGCDFYVEYENVPKNALYWLRNLTTGVEERIFTYENDRITFW